MPEHEALTEIEMTPLQSLEQRQKQELDAWFAAFAQGTDHLIRTHVQQTAELLGRAWPSVLRSSVSEKLRSLA